jgi:hypothetical protein
MGDLIIRQVFIGDSSFKRPSSGGSPIRVSYGGFYIYDRPLWGIRDYIQAISGGSPIYALYGGFLIINGVCIGGSLI